MLWLDDNTVQPPYLAARGFNRSSGDGLWHFFDVGIGPELVAVFELVVPLMQRHVMAAPSWWLYWRGLLLVAPG